MLKPEQFPSTVYEDVRIIRTLTHFLETLNLSSAVSLSDLVFIPLKGGQSSACLYCFSVRDDFYVLRLISPQASPVTRQHQIALARLAGEIGIGPKIYFVDSKHEAIIMEYVQGRPVLAADFAPPARLEGIAYLIRTLHQSKIQFPLAVSPFERFHNFFEQMQLTAFPQPLRFCEIKKLLEEIEGAFCVDPDLMVPSHLDLNAGNILLAGERFYFVDWVNGGKSSPYFDLATFSVFLCLTPDQKRGFLTHYFERPPSQEEWDRFVVTEPIRLFVIAAAYLSLSRQQSTLQVFEEAVLPTLTEFLQSNACQQSSWPHWKIGFTMFKAGLELVDSDGFTASLNSITK